VAGNVAGKCAQSSSQSSVPAQLAIEAYEREDFRQSVKYFNQAVRQSPDSLILQLHLANAQAHWFMHDPHDPEARTQIDAAETTLKDILRKSPESRLALWDLVAIYAMEGRAQDSQKTLAILLHNDPNDSDALTASGTIAAMQIHFDIQAEKRKRNIRLENAARIGDDGIRESLRSEFEPQIQTAVNLLNRAIQNNTQSSQPLVMLNLLLSHGGRTGEDRSGIAGSPSQGRCPCKPSYGNESTAGTAPDNSAEEAQPSGASASPPRSAAPTATSSEATRLVMIARRLLVCGLLTATCSVLVCAGHHSIVVYAVRFGGGSKDLPAALALDATGHAFVVGSTYSEDFPVTTSHRKAQNLSWAAFVTKLAPDASSLVSSTIISGHGMTFSTAAALQPDGQIWVAGSTTALDFAVTRDAQQRQFQGGTPGGAGDAFLVLVSDDGREIPYATFLGGKGDETVTGMVRTSSGFIWVAGWTTSHDFPVTQDALQTEFTGRGSSGFLACFGAKGKMVYATYLGSGGSVAINAMAIDSKGNLVVAGNTSSAVWPDNSPLGGADGFVAKVDSSGKKLRIAKRLGGKQTDQLLTVGGTSMDKTIAAGWTESPAIAGFTGHRNGWIVVLAANGSVERDFAIGGSGFDEVRGLAVNKSDMLLLTGPSDSPDFPTTVDAFRHRGGQPTQAFLAMLNPESGQLLFSTFLGTDAVEGYGIQRGNGVIAGLQDEAYFFGEATADFPQLLALSERHSLTTAQIRMSLSRQCRPVQRVEAIGRFF